MGAIAVALGGFGSAAQTLDPERLSERAFEGAQWVMATQAARAVAQVGARAAAGEGPLGDLIRLHQQQQAALKRLRAELGRDVGAQRQAELSGQIGKLRGELEQLDARIRAEFPDYAEFASPTPLSFDQVRAGLAEDEALIMTLADRTATYVWAISKQDAAWHRAELSLREAEAVVRRIRADLDPTRPARSAVSLAAPSGPVLPSFEAEAAHQLYQQLLAPVAQVLSGKRHVYVVKDGPLSSLPFAVLLQEPAPADEMDAEELRAAHWLIRRHALTTLPSVSSLRNARIDAAPVEQEERVAGFAGFGDPAFGGTPTQGDAPVNRSIDGFFGAEGTRLDAIRRLAPLPGTARELRRIAAMFPKGEALVHLGADATEATIKGTNFRDKSIISFATHGLVTGDISGLAEPALAFTPPDEATALDDGLLTASDASELDLRADWVILSACNTAAGDGTPGAEGLSGLARAFLFAGARSILVSHWPVRDDVAATLTADTLQRLQADGGLRRSVALQQAMLDVMQDESDSSLAHPSAWAPFVLVGEAGALRAVDQ